MKKFKLKVLAASVLAGFVGVSGTAQADSVFAPLVMSDFVNGWYTVVSLKARGNGIVNSGWGDVSKLHYVYNKKSDFTTGNIAGMFNPATGCDHLDGSGKISSWDMLTHTVDPILDFIANNGLDNSSAFTPYGLANGNNFYGNIVISDFANLGKVEGNLSGHAEVYNILAGIMLDYKLLNNHKSSNKGDFGSGFISKASADFQWNPVNRDVTLWLGVATGKQQGDTVSGNYGAIISQAKKNPTDESPAAPHTELGLSTNGVYDNDEVNYSGDKPYAFKCMAFFGRPQIMSSGVLPLTAEGGWVRKSIIPTGGGSGAMIYKAALKIFPSIFNFQVAFNSETTGHLSTSGFGGVPHPNRPY